MEWLLVLELCQDREAVAKRRRSQLSYVHIVCMCRNMQHRMHMHMDVPFWGLKFLKMAFSSFFWRASMSAWSCFCTAGSASLRNTDSS